MTAIADEVRRARRGAPARGPRGRGRRAWRPLGGRSGSGSGSARGCVGDAVWRVAGWSSGLRVARL